MLANFRGPDWILDNVKAVIFDKDGTIIDSHIYWGAIIEKRSQALIEKTGINKDAYESICLAMGYSLEQKKLLPEGPIALVSRERVIEILIDYFQTRGFLISKEEIGDIFVKVHSDFLKDIYKYIKILPGVVDLLSAIQGKGVVMALVTSDSVVNARAIMTHLGLSGYFNLITGMELTPSPKISGIPAIEVCKILEVDPSNTICIGDAPMDIMMGEKANLKACIAVSSGQTPHEELSEKTKYSIKNFYELTIN